MTGLATYAPRGAVVLSLDHQVPLQSANEVGDALAEIVEIGVEPGSEGLPLASLPPRVILLSVLQILDQALAHPVVSDPAQERSSRETRMPAAEITPFHGLGAGRHQDESSPLIVD